MITQVVEGGGWGWLRYGVSKAGIVSCGRVGGDTEGVAHLRYGVLVPGRVGMAEIRSIEGWDRIVGRVGGDG